MLFTLAQLESLEYAIIRGTLRVKYPDREVLYRCLEDMLQLREKMMSSVFLNERPISAQSKSI